MDIKFYCMSQQMEYADRHIFTLLIWPASARVPKGAHTVLLSSAKHPFFIRNQMINSPKEG